MNKIIKALFESSNKSMLQIHTAVLLFGLAGIFGKLINLPSLVIVFGRVFFASIFLYFVIRVKKINIRLADKKDYKYIVLLGIILAFHWVTFFSAIQLSTVAIGLLTFSTFPVFVAFIEPVFFKTKISTKDVFLAFITFIGVVLIIPRLEFSNSMTQGALYGVLSGLSFAILSILNKKSVSKYSSLVIAFYQDCVAAVILLPCVLYLKPVITLKDISLLIILGVIFTGVSHTLFISSLHKIKAYTASIIACLEPLYGIAASVVIIGEVPDIKVAVGGLIILGVTAYSSLKSG